MMMYDENKENRSYLANVKRSIDFNDIDDVSTHAPTSKNNYSYRPITLFTDFSSFNTLRSF